MAQSLADKITQPAVQAAWADVDRAKLAYAANASEAADLAAQIDAATAQLADLQGRKDALAAAYQTAGQAFMAVLLAT